MAFIGWSELILILSILLFLIVPILVIYYFVKHAVRKGIKEALEERVSPLQVTTRICPHCERGISEEAKFCSYCGKELK
ncbi:MAG: zinc ribbon domain-containing protein [Candidatus Bathyarchaeota archaeon]|nr:MAG: zinc ribbon domain-containing protein [Candidatus Bathyarchaeota archaeon]